MLSLTLRVLRLFSLLLILFLAAENSSFAHTNQQQTSNSVKHYAQQLAQIARPLKGVQDLDPLLQEIGERKTVLLGEASHGTLEFYTWRSRITRRLVAEKDFSFIAVEGDWHAFVPVNQYIQDLPGAPASAREALTEFERWPRWMWSNSEVLELVKWLREYNDGRAEQDKVGIYGMDIYGAGASLEKASQYMEKLDAESARKINSVLDCFAPYVDNPRQYLSALARDQEGCAEELEQLMDHLQENREQFMAENPEVWLQAEQNAAVVLRAEKHYRKMPDRDASSWNARARNFYETISRLRDYYGQETGAVAWAHNTHMGDVRATQGSQAMENLGYNARQALGEDEVFIAGFGTHHGQVTASQAWEGERQTMNVPQAKSGSLEDIMHQLNQPDLLFFSREAADTDLADKFFGHRAIGVTYDPENEAGNYVPSIWPERYDAFLFLEETSALKPLQVENTE